MSLEIKAKITCDNCGASIVGPVETSATYGLRTYWEAKRAAKKSHWLFLNRYGKTKHLCQQCADGYCKQKPNQTDDEGQLIDSVFFTVKRSEHPEYFAGFTSNYAVVWTSETRGAGRIPLSKMAETIARINANSADGYVSGLVCVVVGMQPGQYLPAWVKV